MAKKTKNLPFFKIYPGDWLKDFGLRQVSLSARGLFTDMRCMMHQARDRGYLTINGKAPTMEQMTRIFGVPKHILQPLINELLGANVLKKSDKGVLFSPYVVAEESARRRASRDGSNGGNPMLKQPESDNDTIPREARQRRSKSARTSATAKDAGKGKIQWEGKWWYPSELQAQAKLVDKQIEEYRRKMRNSDRNPGAGNSHNVWTDSLTLLKTKKRSILVALGVEVPAEEQASFPMPQSPEGKAAFSLTREELTKKLIDLEERKNEVMNPSFGSRSVYWSGKKMTKLAKDALRLIDEEKTTLEKYERRTYGKTTEQSPTAAPSGKRGVKPATTVAT